MIFTNPSARVGYDTMSFFKQSLTGLNSQFSFSKTSCLTKAEEPSLSYYLPMAGGRKIGFIPFPSVLVLCEIQSVSSRIWNSVTVSISYDDNYYTTDTIWNITERINMSNSFSHSQKENDILWMESEFSYFNVLVQHFNHYCDSVYRNSYMNCFCCFDVFISFSLKAFL